MKALKLTKVGFDNLENRSPECLKWEKIFVEERGITAHKKVADFLKGLDPVNIYLGWDSAVYPRFKVERIEVS